MSCTEEHDKIEQHLKEIERTLEVHVAEAHANLVPANKLLLKEEAIAADSHLQTTLDEFAADSKTDRTEIHRQLEEMGETVLGQAHTDFDGNITRTGGMKGMVDAYENGGLKFKWANLILTALMIVVMAIGTLTTVVLQHSTDTEQVVTDVMNNIQPQLDELLDLEQQENK